MAILTLTLRQLYQNQEIINRFAYVESGTPAAVSLSFGLTSAFGVIPSLDGLTYPADTPFDALRHIQVADTTSIETQVANLYDPADFYVRPFSPALASLVSGNGASPTNAMGFFSSRVTRAVRRGQKRFVGMPIVWIGEGGVIGEDPSALFTTMAYQLGATLTYVDEGNTLTYTPCVLSYEKYTTPRGNVAYKPYSTLAAQLLHLAQGISYTPYTDTRTQVSRQYGRGR